MKYCNSLFGQFAGFLCQKCHIVWISRGCGYFNVLWEQTRRMKIKKYWQLRDILMDSLAEGICGTLRHALLAVQQKSHHFTDGLLGFVQLLSSSADQVLCVTDSVTCSICLCSCVVHSVLDVLQSVPLVVQGLVDVVQTVQKAFIHFCMKDKRIMMIQSKMYLLYY